jgi:two-component system sensor histidine kinase RpfC
MNKISATSTDSFLTRLNKRLKGTGDSEPEQSKLRLVIGFIVLIYICIPWSDNENFAELVSSLAGLIVIFYYSSAVFLFAALVINPVPSQFRRIFGAVLDMGSLSVLMFYTGDETVPLFLIYLWVILGNGFRFGLVNLYVSQAIAIIGFTIVVILGDYWQEHRSFGISLLLMLCALPLYAAFLIKKLQAAIAMAKQANEAKSRFLANMSHELRTPLNGVIGMGDLLRDTKLNFEQKELVNTMHSSANTLLELIENVLDIAKIEAGKVTIESKDFDLHNTVNSVIYMLSPMGQRKGVQVSCSFDADTPFALKGDQQHLRQVLINLVNNAIKFTERGSVSLSIRRVGGEDNYPRIRFEVTDTGIGIAEHNIDKIFEDFTQAESSTRSSFGGTGLGTTISRELVELMGGEIGATSEIGVGSTFWFEIPFVASQQQETILAGINVLLLADEDTANIVRSSLKYWKIEFDWVQSSTRALSQIVQAEDAGAAYDTIIVDEHCLRDIDPLQFAQLARAEGLDEAQSLILINASDAMIEANRDGYGYIATIANAGEKATLFNALHAARSVSSNGSKIISMADHYARQAGVSGLNILIAEDNLVNQQVIEGILSKAGHYIRISSSGDEVLDLLSEKREDFDMLILDMNMPEVSGVEVVKALRFMDTADPMPVVMLTADATPEARERCLEAGANKFLTKPVDARMLLETIATLSRNIACARPAKSVPRKSRTHIRSNFTESAWYDSVVLHELDVLGNDPDFVRTLLRNFEKEGSRHISNVKVSMQNDYLDYRENLHALKGSATELGAHKLVEACLEGEALKPYDLNSDKMRKMCEHIEDAFNNTVNALNNAVIEMQNGLPERNIDRYNDSL